MVTETNTHPLFLNMIQKLIEVRLRCPLKTSSDHFVRTSCFCSIRAFVRAPVCVCDFAAVRVLVCVRVSLHCSRLRDLCISHRICLHTRFSSWCPCLCTCRRAQLQRVPTQTRSKASKRAKTDQWSRLKTPREKYRSGRTNCKTLRDPARCKFYSGVGHHSQWTVRFFPSLVCGSCFISFQITYRIHRRLYSNLTPNASGVWPVNEHAVCQHRFVTALPRRWPAPTGFAENKWRAFALASVSVSGVLRESMCAHTNLRVPLRLKRIYDCVCLYCFLSAGSEHSLSKLESTYFTVSFANCGTVNHLSSANASSVKCAVAIISTVLWTPTRKINGIPFSFRSLLQFLDP